MPRKPTQVGSNISTCQLRNSCTFSERSRAIRNELVNQTIDVVKNVIEPDIYGDIMECWGIKDRSYDTVIMVGIWEILHSPQCAVEQIKRILKPGGKLVFGFPGEDFHLLVPTYTIPHVMSIIEPLLTILKIEGVTYKTDLPIYILGVAKK